MIRKKRKGERRIPFLRFYVHCIIEIFIIYTIISSCVYSNCQLGVDISLCCASLQLSP